MEKKPTYRKNKAKRSANKTEDKIPVITDPASLAVHATNNKPFEFGPKYTDLALPQSSQIQITPIMNALHGDTAVKHLVINHRIWDAKDLKSFLICLSTINTSITKITLAASHFEPNFVEAFTKILKLNPRIKTLAFFNSDPDVISKDGFDKLCDSMEYYRFEELNLEDASLGYLYPQLFESLKYNQSIKTFVLGEGSMYMKGRPFETLCQTLVANPTITDLQMRALDKLDLEACTALKEVLRANYIKKLTFEDCKIDSEGFQLLSKDLQDNTSITELNCRQLRTKYSHLCSTIAQNKSISRLELSSDHLKSTDLQCLNLPTNKTLKELTFTRCGEIRKFQTIFTELIENNTLQRLVVGNNDAELDANLVEQFLTTNKSLTELVIHSIPKGDIITAIAIGLTLNRTLRKLRIKMSEISYHKFRSGTNERAKSQ